MTIPLAERFRTKFTPGPGCWVWAGARFMNGYGAIQSESATKAYAHRVSWQVHFGPVPTGLEVLHRCDNPPCVRPDHLFLGTSADNARDMWAKGRARHQKLTWDDAQAIRGLVAHVSRRDLAARFGVSKQTISQVLRGKTWPRPHVVA